MLRILRLFANGIHPLDHWIHLSIMWDGSQKWSSHFLRFESSSSRATLTSGISGVRRAGFGEGQRSSMERILPFEKVVFSKGVFS